MASGTSRPLGPMSRACPHDGFPCSGSPMLIALAVGCAFLAAVCQTALGFGFALILVPLLSLFWDLKAAIVISLLLSPVSSVLAVTELWRHARWRVVGGLFAGSWVGVPVGAGLLVLASPALLRLLVGLVILLSTSVTLLGVSLGEPRRPMLAALTVGAISGALRSATSMGGHRSPYICSACAIPSPPSLAPTPRSFCWAAPTRSPRCSWRPAVPSWLRS